MKLQREYVTTKKKSLKTWPNLVHRKTKYLPEVAKLALWALDLSQCTTSLKNPSHPVDIKNKPALDASACNYDVFLKIIAGSAARRR